LAPRGNKGRVRLAGSPLDLTRTLVMLVPNIIVLGGWFLGIAAMTRRMLQSRSRPRARASIPITR